MRRWGYYTYSLRDEACIYFEEGPWWVLLTENIVLKIHDLLPDAIGKYYDSFVWSPVAGWSYKRTTAVHIKVDYEEMKSKLYDLDKEDWDLDIWFSDYMKRKLPHWYKKITKV